MTPRRVVILGYGMAGARLAEDIRRADPSGERVALTVLGDEPHPAYNRVLLSTVLAGGLDTPSVALHDEHWADNLGVDLRRNTVVAKIDRAARKVHLADDSTVDYDALVVATGSRAWVPPIDGLRAEDGALAPGVATFRTLADCAHILDQIRPGAPVAVLGGGLLGLEAARGLVGRGSLVTVVHPRKRLMERQLDSGAGRVLLDSLRGKGIEFRLGIEATRYLPGDGLKLADGSAVPADLVVVATGVRAETELAAEAGLAVDRGIVIDDSLRTNDPRIHAIGDCAQHPGTVSGLVAPAWEQAAVLAALLTGTDPAARYHGTAVVTRLKARDIDLAALGETHLDPDTDDSDGSDDVEVVRMADPARGRYAKLVVRNDKVVGAILFGVPDAAATITQLYDRGTPVPEDRLALLLGRALPEGAAATGVGDLPAGALICRCNSISKGKLVSAWREGARDVPALAKATRATTGCGGCRDAVSDLTAWLRAAEPGQ
ncbi:MAG TPA: FAD-dependent oxidoreductase [Pseudonocardiaceae bacterium]|nr:FAD-dependent oxidoreductase [Pseudonocardiaceae bacterium]